MRFGKVSFVLLLAIVVSVGVRAQSRTYDELGRTPTAEEIQAWDIAIGPAGEELPPGRGTAKDGATIYAQKCVGWKTTGGRSRHPWYAYPKEDYRCLLAFCDTDMGFHQPRYASKYV